MKKVFKRSILVGLTLIYFSGCEKDKFLDRPPRDNVDAENFYGSNSQMEIATNQLYGFYSPTDVYNSDYTSDNIETWGSSSLKTGTRKVPVEKGSGSWGWTRLRQINYILEKIRENGDPKVRDKWEAVARFFRAEFYYDKVRRFGDVPWYGNVISASDTALLKKPRDSRELVIDSVMSDLDYAINYLPNTKELFRVTKYTALMLKARVALFEGTFRKYHKLNLPFDDLLQQASGAALELIKSGVYSLYSEGGVNKSYGNLFGLDDQVATETILAANYANLVKTHDLAARMVSPTLVGWGITQDLVNVYLMRDGTKFTDIPNFRTMGFFDIMQNRDPRLTQTTAGPQFTVKGETQQEPVTLNGTSTGYRVIKALPDRSQWSVSHFDIIIYRYAEALVTFAEAKAEIGDITQSDLDISVNRLRDRVGMPHIDLVASNTNPDPYLEEKYPNVIGSNKGVILEIRRERRVEFVNEGFRYWDLMRWKAGLNLAAPELGIYFSGLGGFDFNNDGNMDVFLYRGTPNNVPNTVTQTINVDQWQLYDQSSKSEGGDKGNLLPHVVSWKFDENRDYLYPIPKEDIELNPALEQNPHWDD